MIRLWYCNAFHGSYDLSNRLSLRNLSARVHHDLLRRTAASGPERFDFPDDVKALDDFTEDDMVTVQPRGIHRADEELGAVRVGSGVGHAQNS